MVEPTVFIVDDDRAVSSSMAGMLAAKHLRVRRFGSAEEFLETYDSSQAGCLVLDVRMPGMSGLDLQKKLASDGPSIPVIIITGHGDVPMGVEAMKRGAIDFLEKPYHPEELTDSIRLAIKIDAERRSERDRQEDIQSRIAALSQSEHYVMEQIAAGKANKVVAAVLDMSIRTVELRWATIREKLDVDSRVALAKLLASLHQPAERV